MLWAGPAAGPAVGHRRFLLAYGVASSSDGVPCLHTLCWQVVFRRRKNGLLRRAMELSIMADCDVAVLVFHGTTGRPALGWEPATF